MIKVLMLLMIAGMSTPRVGMNETEDFATMEACVEALPRLDAEAEAFFKEHGKTRKEEYEFILRCVPASEIPGKKDNSI
jgi:hypothetical protein